MLTLLDIDNTIAYYLDRAVIDAGYYPDTDTFLPSDEVGFDTALTALIAANGYVMEVFPHGNYDARAENLSPCIVIQRKEVRPSAVNIAKRQPCFEEFDDAGTIKYRKKYAPQTTFDIDYDVYLIANEVEQVNIMEGLVLQVFQMGEYFIPIKEQGGERVQITDEQQVFIEPIGQGIDMSTDTMMEKLYRYRCNHVGVTPSTDASPDVVPRIEEITIELDADGKEQDNIVIN